MPIRELSGTSIEREQALVADVWFFVFAVAVCMSWCEPCSLVRVGAFGSRGRLRLEQVLQPVVRGARRRRERGLRRRLLLLSGRRLFGSDKGADGSAHKEYTPLGTGARGDKAARTDTYLLVYNRVIQYSN